MAEIISKSHNIRLLPSFNNEKRLSKAQKNKLEESVECCCEFSGRITCIYRSKKECLLIIFLFFEMKYRFRIVQKKLILFCLPLPKATNQGAQNQIPDNHLKELYILPEKLYAFQQLEILYSLFQYYKFFMVRYHENMNKLSQKNRLYSLFPKIINAFMALQKLLE